MDVVGCLLASEQLVLFQYTRRYQAISWKLLNLLVKYLVTAFLAGGANARAQRCRFRYQLKK
jgi:hypothetical protein